MACFNGLYCIIYLRDTLYSYVFARIYGRVPAGIFGIAAFAIGVTLGSGGCRSVCTKGCGV